MIKEIKYNGISFQPSEHLSPSGDLASALNIVPEDGSLSPLSPPKEIHKFRNKEVILQHRTSSQNNYILSCNNVLYWSHISNPDHQSKLYSFVQQGGILSITSIGNTIVVIDSQGDIHYILWKLGGYHYLGTSIPPFVATPSLSSTIYDSTEFQTVYGIQMQENSSLTLTGDGYLNKDVMKKLYDNTTSSVSLYGELRQNVYNRVFATVNQYNKILKDKGLFTSPFYVRFAYRLFDGNHACHTVPILMCPNSWGQPLLTLKVDSGGITTLDVVNVASSLKAHIMLPQNIKDWEDIITHIDVFVTSPILNYTDSAESLVSIKTLPWFKYSSPGVDENGNALPKEWIRTDEDTPVYQNNNGIWQTLIEGFKKQNQSYYLMEPYSGYSGRRFVVTNKGYNHSYLAIDISTSDIRLITDTGYEMPPVVSLPENFPTLPDGGQYKVYDLRGTIVQSNRDFDGYTLRGPRDTSSSLESNHHHIELKRVDGKNYEELLTGYNNFYHFCELQLSEFQSNIFSDYLPVRNNLLSNIESRSTLSETGQSLSRNIFRSVFIYNNRLNTIVQSEYLPFCQPLSVQNFYGIEGEPKELITSTYIKVIENSQQVYYKLASSFGTDKITRLTYFAYPKSTAVELIIIYTNWDRSYYKETVIKLQRHPFLNLSYAFNNFKALSEVEQGIYNIEPTYPINIPLHYNNIIKTSSINNPFLFKEENTVELPVTQIYALSSANKPLSQGQFGQYPLYCFTDSGVWALEVNNQGLYSARQPIIRDIPIDISTITQIDNAVLFATTRGIILLSGSTSQCISDILDGPILDLSQYPFIHKQISVNISHPPIFIPFTDYIKGCGMLYDYAHQHIILYNKHYSYAYVYSLKSQQWGIMESSIKSRVASYPECLAVLHDNTLVDYSQSSSNSPIIGYFVTRPLSFDSPHVHKTITDIIQRGYFRKGHLTTMLYGSRDLFTWHPIYSSLDHYLRGMRGTPYKYFRIAGIFRLDKDESISGLSVQYEERYTNNLR